MYLFHDLVCVIVFFCPQWEKRQLTLLLAKDLFTVITITYTLKLAASACVQSGQISIRTVHFCMIKFLMCTVNKISLRARRRGNKP